MEEHQSFLDEQIQKLQTKFEPFEQYSIPMNVIRQALSNGTDLCSTATDILLHSFLFCFVLLFSFSVNEMVNVECAKAFGSANHPQILSDLASALEQQARERHRPIFPAFNRAMGVAAEEVAEEGEESSSEEDGLIRATKGRKKKRKRDAAPKQPKKSHQSSALQLAKQKEIIAGYQAKLAQAKQTHTAYKVMTIVTVVGLCSDFFFLFFPTFILSFLLSFFLSFFLVLSE
jgi:hypothetical protein